MPLENENSPAVTSETKFERRGFRTEEADAGATEEELMHGMPTHGQVLSAEDADAAADEIQGAGAEGAHDPDLEAEEEVAGEEKKEAKIKIGLREFDNTDAAWAYAQELEQEKIASDAFRQGVEASSGAQKGNTEAAPPEEEDELAGFETEFYSDPKAVLKKYGEKIAEKVTKQIRAEDSTKQKNEETWTTFKSTYPDLAGPDEFSDVQTYIFRPENWANLRHLDTDKALKIAADAVREKYARILKNKMPGQELRTTKTPASPGNGINVTQKEKDEPALNFVAQTKQWKAKRTAKPMRR